MGKSLTGKGGRRPAVALAALAGVVLLGAAAAYACTPQATLKTNPARAETGAVVDIQGTLFDPQGGPVLIRWGSGTGPILATTNADAAGTFTTSITIPQTAKRSNLIQASQVKADGNNFWVSNYVFEATNVPAESPLPATPAPAAQQPAQEQVAAAPAGETAVEATPAPQAADTAARRPSVAAPATTVVSAPAATAAEVVAAAPVEEPAVAEVPAAVETPAAAPAPAPVGDPSVLGTPRTVEGAGGPSPWVLVPMALLGLGLFGVASAIVVHDLRSRRVTADI